ncbi:MULTISPECIES: helix-turn-helix domain-containing protein [Tenacibaculum]|uniref:Helix-turn-helix domain-containing protein n=2 Tax=Tenacibaculum TaxID=104267 RepID=A0AAE9SFL8_9FLAO|nr:MULTISPECIES: helix-turn-helix domain-containing protein [Tenacibaculum]GFD75527.1 AraC family transcriptional regulator [Tenacibaculum sp. KUL113]GFD78218.1 AraC family transcriptional regulator [Tenacibaculum sp. KUL118]GFD91473.1 AraC family transcriptional regulator [Alteromonas sp. KUL154]GFE01462.1 AraC family transcriptional regulator [Alteromonas sp. KUL156]AZJ32961.1 helix-turn-helix domain-containing protein [Tenacibaculum mesophilum]
MAVQDIQNYSYQNIFSLQTVQFEESCVVNSPQQINQYKVFWIKEGTGKYNIDFKSYSFEDGVLFFLSPGQVFSVDSEKIKEAYQLSFTRDFYCIQTHDAEVSCNGVLFNNIYETPFVVPSEKETQKLDFILQNLKEEFELEETAQYDMLQSLLKQFIVYSVRIKKEKDVVKESVETKLFKDFSLLVEQNFKKIHRVTGYAYRLGLSPKSLTKHLQKIGTETPSDFIKNRIITEAKRLLLYTDDSIKQVAFDLGFNDPAYFSRFFTKATGQSPKQFKRSYSL